MKDDKFLFDLQLFADGGDGGGAGGAAGAGSAGEGSEAGKDISGKNDNGGGKADPGKEAEVQKRIDDAIAAAKSKWEKEYQKKAEAAKKEAERLSKLSEDERKKAELENTRKELEAREKELQTKELKLEMVKVLSDRNIPVEFMDFLIAGDSESTMKNITTFEAAMKKLVEAKVNEKLKGKAPKAGDGTGGKAGVGVEDGFFKAIKENQVKRR